MTEWSLIPQSVAAVATSAAAGAAWRSARASQRTSQDAQRALAVGIAPMLTIEALRWGEPERDQLVVENRSEWDALSVEVEVVLKSGQQFREHAERLRPLILRDGNPTGERVLVDLGEADTRFPTAHDNLASVAVRFWDERRIRRYELAETYPGDPPLTRRLEHIEGP